MKYRNVWIVTAMLSWTPATATANQNVQIGVFRPSNGNWYWDTNGNNQWDGTPTDAIVHFGQQGDRPVVMAPAHGNCSFATVAVVRPPNEWFVSDASACSGQPFCGHFFFGTNPLPIPLPLQTTAPSPITAGFGGYDSGIWEFAQNISNVPGPFGTAGDMPVFGVWNPSASAGKSIGVWRPSAHTFFLDFSGDSKWDAGDVAYDFGAATDLPLSGDFNSNHPGDEIGTFRNGSWFVDLNGDGAWDSGDTSFAFGQAGDIPVVSPLWKATCIQ